MPTRIMLDSNIIAALYFKDPFSERVERTVANYDELHTLDLAYSEVGNVAWKRVCIFKEDAALISKSLDLAAKFIQNNCNISSSGDYLIDALHIGLDNRITIYDSLYLMVAMHLKIKLLTADEELYRKVHRLKKMENLVTLPIE